jgi:hypothetical protein
VIIKCFCRDILRKIKEIEDTVSDPNARWDLLKAYIEDIEKGSTINGL